ncbi:MAG: type II toxin-antitoxin system VapC family toxin [Proteobacteria bacterium]|nr:type II toxin-antitoxin system VapC family toxin [Pseudomonadota bacterium]
MNLLLDTHVLIWWDVGHSRLAKIVRDAIAQPSNQVYVSAATIWEISVKRAMGKLVFRRSPTETVERSGFQPLPITLRHAERAGELPRHHNDPFDRLLVAQAEIEGFVLATQDRQLARYGVTLLGVARARTP